MPLEFPAVTLARYAQRINYRDCAFWGVRHSSDDNYACNRVWSQAQRDMVSWSLLEAQDEMEQQIGFLLRPRWTVENALPWREPLLTRLGYVIAGGIMGDTMLANSLTPNYLTTDPLLFDVTLGTCSAADVRLFHEDTDIEIYPLSYEVSTGVATFTVPLCRLVDPAHQDNPPEGWDYADSGTWAAQAIDARCITNDPSVQAEFISRHGCGSICAQRGCSDYRHTGCLYVRDGRLGIVDVTPGHYADGEWHSETFGYCCACPERVDLYYYSGLTPLTRQAEDAIIRLGHSKMPSEPCGCDITRLLWSRDRAEPPGYTRERMNCRFGTSAGAWFSWQQALAMQLGRASTL
jgi:hypothetical protein